MDQLIFVSIASYRDPDLVNTVRSCYDNANNKEMLFFSVFSQAEDVEHADLSFIPESQIRYLKTHWSESKGACWARSIATKDIVGEYFLQIDSHSRFTKNWDLSIIANYTKAKTFWGNRLILTNYPDPFELTEDSYKELPYDALKKIEPVWDEDKGIVVSKMPWSDVVDQEYGDETIHICAGCVFTTADIMRELPYDDNVYFEGEEFSLALRAYTRGIRIVSPIVKFMFTNYNLANSKRHVHWQDNPGWGQMRQKSDSRLSDILSGNTDLGDYGIKSPLLFEQYQKIVGIPINKSPIN
jgi:hypothetical protein